MSYEFYPKGSTIFNYQDSGDKFYVIVKGKISIHGNFSLWSSWLSLESLKNKISFQIQEFPVIWILFFVVISELKTKNKEKYFENWREVWLEEEERFCQLPEEVRTLNGYKVLTTDEDGTYNPL